jgi:hypothetical protein
MMQTRWFGPQTSSISYQDIKKGSGDYLTHPQMVIPRGEQMVSDELSWYSESFEKYRLSTG